jgi:hypothetical protein
MPPVVNLGEGTMPMMSGRVCRLIREASLAPRLPRHCGWMRLTAATAALLSAPMPALAAPGEVATTHGMRVAQFAAAERMDGGHAPDTLSFRVAADGQSIRYLPRSGAPISLRVIDRTAEALRVRAPDDAIWRIDIHDGAVRVADPAHERPRIFFWHGRQESVASEALQADWVPELEAIAFVRNHFLR